MGLQALTLALPGSTSAPPVVLGDVAAVSAAIEKEQKAIALEPDNATYKNSLKKLQSKSGSKAGK